MVDGTAVTNGANGKSANGANGSTQKRYTGKNHKWAVSPATRLNDGLITLAPTLFFVFSTIWFSKSELSTRFFTWLNDNYTPWEINVYWTLGITTGSYWLIGVIFMAFDMFDPLHNLVKKYKLQPDIRLTWTQYLEVMRIAGRNLLFVNIPLTLLTAHLYPLRTTLPLPSGWTIFGHYWLCMLFEEVGFYAVHRTVHSKRLYAKVHKLHHTFTAPIALASTYCSMTEHLFSNLLPIITPFYIVDAHWIVSMMFFASLQVGTLCTHSGYNIPGLFNALQHDWHHYAYTENFGPTGLLDGILGTDKNFKVWLGELKLRDKENWWTKGRVELAEKTQ